MVNQVKIIFRMDQSIARSTRICT